MTNASRSWFVFLLLAPLLAAAPASAQLCPPDHVGCFEEDVDFLHRDALFMDVMFDTGWVPSGSPLQVRFALFAGASTEVEMGGTSVTSWPPPLNETVPGRPGTGRFYFNYGIEVVARLRFDVEVAGIRYTWEGDIPIPGGIPRDLRLSDEVGFDPFVLPPSDPRPITAMDMTSRFTVLDVPITDAFIPIPGISGGFAVDAVASMETLYRTNTIEVGDAVDMIEMENESVVVRADPGAPELGGAKDVVITPHGTITYEGLVTLSPLVYVEIAGRRFDLTIVDIPIPVPAIDVETDFNTEEVHVPLPDIRVSPTSITFEDTHVGAMDAQLLTIHNDGEASLAVGIRPLDAPFGASSAVVMVPPASSQAVELTFTPEMGGDRTGVLFLDTNDPDEPLVTVPLNATAIAAPMPDGGPPGDAGLAPPTDGGCGCRAASSEAPGPVWIALFGLFLVSRARRRRRRCARDPS